MVGANWTHFPHQADMGVRGVGPTRAAAFEQAVLAMTAVVTDPAQVDPATPVNIRCEAPDDELLLGDWLNASSWKWHCATCCSAVLKSRWRGSA